MSFAPVRPAGRFPVVPLGALVALLLLIGLAIVHLRATPALAPDAPAGVFSAQRAMRHVQHIAQAPHVTGSAANAQVRAYLLEQLRLLGYAAEVQSGLQVSALNSRAGMVHNIVLRVPGTRPGKALMLVAHYDSAPWSFGAADDGAGVAAILETLRALRTGAALQNDLICLFTDGEEAGLLGAQLFMDGHRLANDVGLALNFEFRGNRGPIWMFETSAGNSALIRGWSRTVDAPLGNSLLSEVYRHLPNDTDMSVFKAGGIAGLNFAAGEGHTSYHSVLDRAELLDPDSLQHMGQSMLSLTRHFGTVPLQQLRGDDSIYFDVPGLGLAAYPGALALPLSAALVLLLGLAMAGAHRQGRAGLVRTACAALAIGLGCVLIAVACQLLWQGILKVHPGYQLLVQGDTYNGNWYLGAMLALALGLFAWMLRCLRRRFKADELTLGALLLSSLLGVASSLFLPGASFLFTLPALPVALAVALLSSPRAAALGASGRTGALTLALAPGVLVATPVVYVLAFALTQAMIGVTVLLTLLVASAATPLIEKLIRPFVLPYLPLWAGVLLLAAGSASAGFDAQHPRPDNVYFVQDSAAGQAYWISEDAQLDAWTRQFFPAPARRQRLATLFGAEAPSYWTGAAAALAQAAPELTLMSDRSDAVARHIVLRIRSARGAARMRLYVDGIAVQAATLQGRALLRAPSKHWRMETVGVSDQALRLELDVKPGQAFALRLRDISYGLPATARAPRPPELIVQPFYQSDTTQLASALAFSAH